MVYWFTVVSKWFQHVHILFFAVLIADFFLVAVYSNGPSNILPNEGNYSGKSDAQAFLLVLFGPLINLYGFYKCCKSFWEYESDTYLVWESSKPKALSRKIWSNLSGPVLAAIYCPPVLWFYTNGISFLWGKERYFFNTPGFFLSLAVGLVCGFLFQVKNKEFKKYQKQIEGQ